MDRPPGLETRAGGPRVIQGEKGQEKEKAGMLREKHQAWVTSLSRSEERPGILLLFVICTRSYDFVCFVYNGDKLFPRKKKQTGNGA